MSHDSAFTVSARVETFGQRFRPLNPVDDNLQLTSNLSLIGMKNQSVPVQTRVVDLGHFPSCAKPKLLCILCVPSYVYINIRGRRAICMNGRDIIPIPSPFALVSKWLHHSRPLFRDNISEILREHTAYCPVSES
jgi:hypothetical protein